MLKNIAVAVAACVGLAAFASAQSKNDYGDPKSWLCRPGVKDACDTDLTTTIIAANGDFTVEKFTPNPNAPIDCFYVYPTVSTDPSTNSDMTADAAELNVIRQQFARFTSKCRPYAPLYRQVTLAGLRTSLGRATGLAGNPFAVGLQYDDVRDAWHYYLEHDNNGRGFVLVAHSQGAFIAAELIRKEIEGKPVQSQMISAILLGTSIHVPPGENGTFRQIPLCQSSSQTGCVITYASFRSTVPPQADALFGRPAGPNLAACTNPAALGGGSGALHAYLSTNGTTIVGTSSPKPWAVPEKPISTPWVSVPGLLSARCASNNDATFLEITVNANPADPRTDDITGDLTVGNQVLPSWGLHLVDVNLAQGNLIDIVEKQTKAWIAAQ
jgi:Protein of unknown function (DUF3089)